MVANRMSIIAHGKLLAELVIEGGGTLPQAKDRARKLLAACNEGGTYQKKYDDPQERVLNRHLNLYRNKLAAAKTDAERFRWKGKIVEQEAKLKAFKADLDLDGL